MESLEKKTFTTSRGFTFTYYISQPAGPQLTLLLHHGFPNEAQIWSELVKKLGPFRLVVPDLLGYSGSSKPTDPVAYNDGAHTRDLVEILDAEGIEQVVSVGHDFGSVVAQRLYTYHPERVSALVLISVPYMLPPESSPDLKELNNQLEKSFGNPLFAYQEFFISDEAPALIKANLDRFYDAVYGASPDWIRKVWAVRGAMRSWLSDDTGHSDVIEYAQDPAVRHRFVERLRRDGLEAPLCYYKAMNSDVQYNTLKELPRDNFIVRVPLLYVACAQDIVCRAEFMIPAKQGGFLPDVEEATVDCGHWGQVEKPDEIAELINSFLERKFPSAARS